MRLIDKDKTLEELNGGYEQSLGIIEGSRYCNINDIEDAIDTVKYADEIDISEHDSKLLDKFVTRLKDYFVIPHDVSVIEQMAEELKEEVNK